MNKSEFDNWNNSKKIIHSSEKIPYFYEREIWFLSTGINIGVEQNGKGEDFSRPIVILRKFNKKSFGGIPLSTQEKSGKYYHSFAFKNDKKSYANLSQLKLFSAQRLIHKIGMIPKEEYKLLQEKVKSLIDGQ